MVKKSEYAVELRNRLVTQIRDFAVSHGFRKVVIGISGGKDSAVAAALCARALGPENVFGVMLPNGDQVDIGDSIKVCKRLKIPYRTININDMFRGLMYNFSNAATKGETYIPYDDQSKVNVAPRLRMTALRYVTQALGARLVGTGNLSEITVGYCTKDGDTSCDFSVLGALTSIEVVQVGLTMPELPASIVKKTPSDGLCGFTDEEKLGISYADIHKFIREGTCGNPAVDQKISHLEQVNRHKRFPPPVINPLVGMEAGKE